jgi:hypothetical protein
MEEVTKELARGQLQCHTIVGAGNWIRRHAHRLDALK